MTPAQFLAAWFLISVVSVGLFAVATSYRRTSRSPFGPIRSGVVVPLPMPDDYVPCACGICTGPDVA